MTLDQIIALMTTRDITRFQGMLDRYIMIENHFKDARQYHPEFHDIHDKTHRRDKIIMTTPENPNERPEASKVVKVARLSLALQKKIVLMAAAFLGIPETECTPANPLETDLLTIINQISDNNKLEYRFPEICEMVMSERHCAELWYLEDVDQAYWTNQPIDTNLKLSMRLLANSKGDWLYPVFDEYENLIAFGRGYMTREAKDDQIYNVAHLDIYTADKLYYSKQLNNVWLFRNVAGDWVDDFIELDNPIGKIPVIYYWQKQVEWSDVQCLIERLETKISNHADTNDYFDSPIVFTKGTVNGFADKNDSGKLLQGENDAEVSYVTWDNAPASMEMEIKNLMYMIHSLTHTPDITFENLKGLGNLSGIALKLLFLDAHLKASRKEPIFAESLQRRYNWLKTAISIMDKKFVPALNMKLRPKFQYFMPEDTAAVIATLNTAVTGGILSTETAIDQNPLVTDPETEKGLIKTEVAQAQQNALDLANASKPAATPPQPING